MGVNLTECVQQCLPQGGLVPYTTDCLGICFTEAGWQAPPSEATTAWCSSIAVVAVLLSMLVSCILASTLGLDTATIQVRECSPRT